MKGGSTREEADRCQQPYTGSSSYSRIIRAFAHEYEQITAMVQASLHALPIATSNSSSCSTALSCSSPCSSAWEHCHTGTQAAG